MIIISPYAKQMRDGKPHPKNYPYWEELVAKITEPIIQIGVTGEKQLVPDFRQNLPLSELAKLVNECTTWISVDSFFQHFCWDLKKPGIVLFGQSDPKIFGHPENINLYSSPAYFREKQFWLWEQATFNAKAFVTPEVVLASLSKLTQALPVSS